MIKEYWFKISILIILIWFAYSYLEILKYNSYVECNSTMLVNNKDKNSGWVDTGAWRELCEIALRQKNFGWWTMTQNTR